MNSLIYLDLVLFLLNRVEFIKRARKNISTWSRIFINKFAKVIFPSFSKSCLVETSYLLKLSFRGVSTTIRCVQINVIKFFSLSFNSIFNHILSRFLNYIIFSNCRYFLCNLNTNQFAFWKINLSKWFIRNSKSFTSFVIFYFICYNVSIRWRIIPSISYWTRCLHVFLSKSKSWSNIFKCTFKIYMHIWGGLSNFI